MSYNLLRFLILFFSVTFSFPTLAGTSFPQKIKCPVGGEEFTFHATASCTTFGRSMSFMPITSCGNLYDIPRCPINGLPLFKTFSEEESKQLEHFLEMNDLKDKSKWIASYLIAEELGLNDREQLDFLIFAFWYETEEFIKDKQWLKSLVEQYKNNLTNISEDEQTVIQIIIAYAALLASDNKTAQTYIHKANQMDLNDEYILTYAKRVKSCSTKWVEEKCGPHVPVDELFEDEIAK